MATAPEGRDVEVINTQGMAVFGPGSEWLWTMLQFLALTITFVAIYRQLRAQHVQTHENGKFLRSQAHFTALSLLDRPWELLMADATLSAIVTVGSATPDALSETDRARFSAYCFMQFNGWEYAYYQFHDGSIPKELWLGTDTYLSDQLQRNPGVARVWTESRHAFDDPFRSHVEQVIATGAAPAEPFVKPAAAGS